MDRIGRTVESAIYLPLEGFMGQVLNRPEEIPREDFRLDSFFKLAGQAIIH